MVLQYLFLSFVLQIELRLKSCIYIFYNLRFTPPLMKIPLKEEVQKGLNGSMSKAHAKVKVIKLQFETLIPP